MRRLRIYLTSIIAGLAGAVAVLWVSARMERHAAEQYLERLRQAPLPLDFQGGYGYVMGGPVFGPGLLTLFLAILVFTTAFRLMRHWHDR
jgi:hypothetical protein